MDKNQILGFVLIFAVLIGWSIWTAPSKEEIAERQRVQDSLELVKLAEEAKIKKEVNNTVVQPEIQREVPDSVAVEELKYTFGSFASAAQGEDQDYILENQDIKLTFGSKGGFIKDAVIKNHLKIIGSQENPTDKIPVQLLEDSKNSFSYSIPLPGRNQTIESKDLYFTGQVSGNRLTLTAAGSGGTKIVQEYTLADEGFHIDYNLDYAGIGSGTVQLNWVNYLDTIEHNTQFEKRYSTVYYKEAEEDGADYCSCASNDTEDLSGTPVEWVAHSNQFFTSALMAEGEPFKQGVMETDMLEEDAEDLKMTRTSLEMPISAASGSVDMAMYVGPIEYDRLVAMDNDLEYVIPFGNSIFGSINRHFIRPFFNFLRNYLSIGLVIVVVIFIIKMALYPLMYKMLHSQAKMGALKPELASLKEKYKDEPQKSQMETMKIYREYGVSPFGGCMPMLLQMPIWYALFRFFPASIDFRQEGFLWATDLSSYDVWFNLPFSIPMFGAHVSLFTILWAITTIIYTYYNTKHMDMSANPAMKYVQYFMPVGFLVFFNSYASALTCYMFFSNLINISQTIITKRFVFDDEKIREELMKNKAKPKKKKSGFQARLEEAMKQQQQVASQRQQQQSKKKGKRK